MKEKLNGWYRKLLSRLLTLLGFGSTFGFMACYGPAPEDYDYHVKVFPDHLFFDADNSKPERISVATDGEWIVTEVTPFMTVGSQKGNRNSMLTVQANDNTSGHDREGIIVVQSAVEPQHADTVYVYQEGKKH